MHLARVVTVSASLFSLTALATSTPALKLAESDVQTVEVREPSDLGSLVSEIGRRVPKLFGGSKGGLFGGSKGGKTPSTPSKPPPAPAKAPPPPAAPVSKPPTQPSANKQPGTKPSNSAVSANGKSSAAPSPSATAKSASSISQSASSISQSASSNSKSALSSSASTGRPSSSSSAPACQRSGKARAKKGGSVAARAGEAIAPRGENTAIGGTNNLDPDCDGDDAFPRAQMDCSGDAAETCATMCYAANCFGSSRATGLQLEGLGKASSTGALNKDSSNTNRAKVGCTSTIKTDLENQGVSVAAGAECDEWPPNSSRQGGTGALIQMVGGQAAQAAALKNAFGRKAGRQSGLILMRNFQGVPECAALAAKDTSKCGKDPKFMMFTNGKYRMATFANLGQTQAADFGAPAPAPAPAADSTTGQ